MNLEESKGSEIHANVGGRKSRGNDVKSQKLNGKF